MFSNPTTIELLDAAAARAQDSIADLKAIVQCIKTAKGKLDTAQICVINYMQGESAPLTQG